MSSAASARNTQVPQTTGDTQYNVPHAALRGATSAFSKPPVKPKPKINTYTGGANGALLAATKVGTSTPRESPNAQRSFSPLRADWTGGSNASRPRSHAQFLSRSTSSSTLDVPADFLSDRNTSPSNIAAKLAAARYSPLKPIPFTTTMPTSITSERDANERDVLPPPGSVGHVLAKINSRTEQEQPPPKQRGRSLGLLPTSQRVETSHHGAKKLDAMPILSTKSPANKVDTHYSTTPVNRVPEPFIVSQKAPPPVKSPKPQRKIFLPVEPKDLEDHEIKRVQTTPAVQPKPTVEPDTTLSRPGPKDFMAPTTSFTSLRKDSLGILPSGQRPGQLKAVKSIAPRPKPPLRSETQPQPHNLMLSTSLHRRLSTSVDSNENMSSPSSYASAPETQEEKQKPALPPPRRATKVRSISPDVRPKTATLPVKMPASSKGTSPARPVELAPPQRPRSVMGTSPSSVYHSNYQRESVKAITKHMTGESLSNAIVGAALASSRNASPAPPSMGTTNPPLPARKHHHYSPFHHGRSPSPPKPTGKLRPTLRKEPSASSDEEEESDRYKRKGTRILGVRRKHPNKHHEGDRKRWRDTVTERERKRYEGVWAANKGLHIASALPSSRASYEEDVTSDVLNLVTKEIWLRSRLPELVLEEVWDLVDTRGIGRLKREEFVVGMWLIDQRLKGRKLPVKVSESVWGSVRGVGVKVKVHK